MTLIPLRILRPPHIE